MSNKREDLMFKKYGLRLFFAAFACIATINTAYGFRVFTYPEQNIRQAVIVGQGNSVTYIRGIPLNATDFEFGSQDPNATTINVTNNKSQILASTSKYDLTIVNNSSNNNTQWTAGLTRLGNKYFQNNATGLTLYID